VLAVLFSIDKGLVSFTGRPPLLSGRFISTPFPLDIDDEVLLSDENTIARAAAGIDSAGWNTFGDLASCSFTRARAMIAFVQGEILECALHARTQPTTSHIMFVALDASRMKSILTT
jgi:hypothetical protein